MTDLYFFSMWRNGQLSRNLQITRDKTTELFNDSRKKSESNSQIQLALRKRRLWYDFSFYVQELTIPYRIPVIMVGVLSCNDVGTAHRHHNSEIHQQDTAEGYGSSKHINTPP